MKESEMRLKRQSIILEYPFLPQKNNNGYGRSIVSGLGTNMRDFIASSEEALIADSY